MTKPRILYVTYHCPHDQPSGGQIRTLQIGRLLQRCGEVRLVQLGEVEPAALAKTKAEFLVEAVMKLQANPVKGLRARLRHELDPWCVQTHHWTLSRGDVSRISELAAQHDVVWFYSIIAANRTSIGRWPKSVVDTEDLLSHYFRSAASQATSWLERGRHLRKMWLWKRRENVLLQRFNVVSVCSEADRQYLGASQRIHTIPNGYGDSTTEPKRCPANPKRIGFIGTLIYPPNRQGVEWFIANVWPAIKKADPSVRLRLVGPQTDSEICRLGPDIDGLGWVEDASAEIATWSLMIVPVRVGAGTRIKIAEGFSRKCPMVSTTLGAFGYDIASGKEILLADPPEAFAGACLSLLKDARLGEQLADRAWQKYIQHWTWSAIAPKVAGAVDHCLSLSKNRYACKN